ncbi:hypothetical protein ACFL6M_03460 [Candidatus Eisenbacteria bacterium]|uniref:Uncharacterized protein n=1 Tax=Eiseniibacteriota bacterium TaxID=2212470 RepID=A0ABV6YK05_UNCEI
MRHLKSLALVLCAVPLLSVFSEPCSGTLVTMDIVNAYIERLDSDSYRYRVELNWDAPVGTPIIVW